MTSRPVTVAETPLFLRQAEAFWPPADHEAFVDFIARNPTVGEVIPGTGGVRKVRWSRPGMGKRGGARIIYFYQDADHPLYLLLAYAKAQRENVSPAGLQAIGKLVAILKGRREH